MRSAVVAAALSMIAGTASAQDWAGPYVGIAFSAQAASDGDTKTQIDPGLDARLSYTTPPPGRSYEGPSLSSAVSPVLYAGWRRPAGTLIWGIEGRLEEGGGSTAFDSGPGPQNMAAACGVPALGCLYAAFDGVEADITIERSAELRLSVGMPVGNQMLVSAYAGPAVAWGSLDMVQTSRYFTGRLPVRGVDCVMHCPPTIPTSDVTVTQARTENDTALGVVGGVTLDVKLTDRVIARADLGYRRFEALRGSTGGTNGADSEVWSQPAGFAGGIGISVRF